MLKSIVDYKIKNPAFEQLLYGSTLEKAGEFTVKQLEIVVWAISKRMQSEFDEPMTQEARQLRTECIQRLCEVLKLRSASMKARGVSFAVEAITQFYQVGKDSDRGEAAAVFID